MKCGGSSGGPGEGFLGVCRSGQEAARHAARRGARDVARLIGLKDHGCLKNQGETRVIRPKTHCGARMPCKSPSGAYEVAMGCCASDRAEGPWLSEKPGENADEAGQKRIAHQGSPVQSIGRWVSLPAGGAPGISKKDGLRKGRPAQSGECKLLTSQEMRHACVDAPAVRPLRKKDSPGR
jgi:hypothetical protein